MMSFWDRETFFIQESMYVLSFDTKNHFIGVKKLFVGGTSSITLDRKLIYAAALTSGAQAIAVAHNHPSGDYHPSLQDIAFTKALHEGCKTIDIKLLDHMIVTDEGYYSFSDEDFLR